MAIDGPSFTADAVRERLHALFEAGKSKDEFEFGCTLLRVRGLEDAGWDPFVETHRLVEDLTSLIGAPLAPHTQVRLGLLLYSHLTEVGSMYDVLANLTRVVTGERYVVDPFLDHCPANRKGERLFLSTPSKVRSLKNLLAGAGFEQVAELLDWFFEPSVRNSFAHADYTLHGSEFRSRSGLFEIGGIRTPELPLRALEDLFNRALNFYDTFVAEYNVQRRGYGANKVVRGRIGGGPDPEPVELLADPARGLYGFRSPPGDTD
jgi:hypothetical protein